MKDISAVVYDWDDVIQSVAHTYFRLLKGTSTRLSSQPFSFEEFSNVYGLPEDLIIRTLFPGLNINLIVQTYRELRDSIQYPLIPGAKDALTYTITHYPVNGILTARRRERLNKRAREAGVNLQPFTFILTAEDAPYHKPDPRVSDPVKEILLKYGVVPNEAVYVGDSVLDHQASTQAGLAFVGVLTGITERHKFVESGVSSDEIMPSIAELPKFLERG